ncbi:MAG: pentapeptide repeat-containing protein, partial [Dolichospermum sp.]
MSIKLWFRGLSAFVLTIILSLTLFSLPANAFVASDVLVTSDVLVNLKRLLEKNECNKCNLSGVDLSGKDLY